MVPRERPGLVEQGHDFACWTSREHRDYAPVAVPSDRILFKSPIVPREEAKIEAALAPLVAAGYIVTVMRPDYVEGYRILVDGQTSHASLHVRPGADAAEWGLVVSRYLSRPN
jgi:hypothetical protein